MLRETLEQLKDALRGKPRPQAVSAEAKTLLFEVCREAVERFPNWGDRIKLSELQSWALLKGASDDSQIDVAILAARREVPECDELAHPIMYAFKDVLTTIASQLLRSNLPFREEHAIDLAYIAASQSRLDYGFPTLAVVSMVERLCDGHSPEGDLKTALKAFLKRLAFQQEHYGATQSTAKIRARLEAVLDPPKSAKLSAISSGQWGTSVQTWIEGVPPEYRRDWETLIAHASTAADKSKPSKKWLAEARPAILALTEKAVLTQLQRWFEETRPDPTHPDPSLDVLKGLIWSAVHLDHDQAAFAIGRFAEVCFTKVPNFGARSQKLGNACLLTLGAMVPSGSATAELVRLKQKAKYPNVREQIEKILQRAAEQLGKSLDELEQQALPDFGLGPDGTAEIDLGGVTATISLDDSGVSLGWTGSDGKPRKTPPALVRREYPDELKDLKRRVKDISSALSGQIAYLESSYLEDRSWPLELWAERFLDHPVRRNLAAQLIWQLTTDNRVVTVMLDNASFKALSGEVIEIGRDAVVQLWHPLMSGPDDVLAWRSKIVEKGFTQPFKQAHREVYALTDAERKTDSYSNRFAAHILRQHQFRALCQARGWRYDLQGDWDSWNLPTRSLNRLGLVAEFDVEAVANEELSEAYVALYLSSDQVRFCRISGDRLNLSEVPPMVFSEVMRDVDLFVSITSVANDPDWTDGGPDGSFRAYWTEHAFGDLNTTAKTRREVLTSIISKLAIADRLSLSDRFLEVRGNRHCYKIHLGSGNVMILPANRYLCIVRGAPDRKTRTVRLPFAGDAMLSIILSKAYLLADDDKITDRTILNQIEY